MAHKIEISETLIRGVKGTWQAIAPDLEGVEMDNLDAIESCIDADRMFTFGYKEADKELKKLYQEQGPTGHLRILKAIAKEVHLV